MAQSNTGGGTSSRRHRDVHHDSNTLGSSRYDTEWEAREAARQRELEEARARAAQMEKTMRWWSDCTANWREKWSKVRNERNKSREEAKILRSKLEAALKDTNSFKRDKVELESINVKLRDELDRMQQLILRDWEGGGEKKSEVVSADVYNILRTNRDDSELDSVMDKEFAVEEYVLQGAVPKHAIERFSSSGKDSAVDGDDLVEEHDSISKIGDAPDSGDNDDEFSGDLEYLHQKMSMLQLRLDESQKMLQAEREERNQLKVSLEKAQVELADVKGTAEDLSRLRHEAAKEIINLQANQQQAAHLAQLDKRDEAAQRDSLDRRLAGLRAEVGAIASNLSPGLGSEHELERLQAENATEWGKRERLETEKLSLERENKKLRAEIRDLQERLERRGRPMPSADAELRQVQQELSDRGKELTDLKHSHTKLKKVLQDKSTELSHAIRRAEQYEAEVKRLRTRVEELKKELATAEDEADTATNNIRKLQRTNEELQEQIESMQVQVRHLETSDDRPQLDEPSAPPPSNTPSPTP
ncbi:coiled-coil domain-containing protein 102A-like isoform X2 [Neocloeon triangulifer]|uniref:coiled-coil domain-containing protein 102A-like isoform X2 n=1 Tax=Neocloeon triangulifer TaxID=2078957 RepID=UPI00286F7E10|nr:coiled-coil domain-containing protein 102A-like isoform X2 [Neocloeon triangulifer]